MYSQCRQMKNCFNSVAEWAHGSKGVAPCNRDAEVKRSQRSKSKNAGGHQQEQIDLVAMLRAGKRYNEGYYGANSSMTACWAAWPAIRKEVKWDDAVASKLTQFPKASHGMPRPR